MTVKCIIEYSQADSLNTKDDYADGLPPAQTVVVAKDGGDFTSIKAAIDSIVDASSSKPYAVLVYPGVYTEAPMTLKQFVAVEGVALGAAIVFPSNNASPLFTHASNTSVRKMFLYCPTSSSGCYAGAGVNLCQIEDCFFSAASLVNAIAVRSTGSGSGIIVEECKTFTNIKVGTQADAGGRIDCSNVLQYAETAFYADSGTIWIHNSGGQYNTNGLYAAGSGIIYPHNVTLENVTYGIRIGASGANAEIRGDGVTCRGSTTYDLYQQAAGIIDITSGSFREDFFSITNWTTVDLDFASIRPQTVGNTSVVARSFQVGVPEKGELSEIGQGSAYVRGMIAFTTDSAGGNLTDVSAAARSRTGSTFTFQGTAAGHMIYVGSDLSDGSDKLKHWGLRILQTTAAVEAVKRSFVFEYYNGSTWVTANVIAASSDQQYRYANEVFIRGNSDERISYGIDNAATWSKTSIGGYNLYWMRIRVTNNLTTAPVFEQFRLGPSRAIFGTNAALSHWGRSRFKLTLQAGGNIFGESGGVTDTTFNVGSGGVPTGWAHDVKNCLLNSDGDAIYWQTPIPKGTDTGYPFYVEVSLLPTASDATPRTIIVSCLPIEQSGVLEADPTGGTTPVARTLANTETLTANVAQTSTINTIDVSSTTKLRQYTFGPFNISNYYAGDMLLMRLEGDSMGSADICIISVALVGVKIWHGDRL